MKSKYPNMGLCGLPCQLCGMYHLESKGKCEGCKSPTKQGGCNLLTCAKRKQNVEFCWECDESYNCEKWQARRDRAKQVDSVKCCHQMLEGNISYIQKYGIEDFRELQNKREKILEDILESFNEGRSKSYYCVAATVMDVAELEEAVVKAKKEADGLGTKEKSKILHLILDEIAERKNYNLKLRRPI